MAILQMITVLTTTFCITRETIVNIVHLRVEVLDTGISMKELRIRCFPVVIFTIFS